jgi:colanic acid biosynthesis protein WcaH
MPAVATRLSDEDFAHLVRHGILSSIDIVLRDPEGMILVGRRTNEPARGLYFVPGGAIRKNERIADAFARILMAETGLALAFSQARLLGVYEHIYPTNRYGDPAYGTHYIVQGYELGLRGRPDVPPDAQHSDFRWMTSDALLAAPDVHENTKVYLRP